MYVLTVSREHKEFQQVWVLLSLLRTISSLKKKASLPEPLFEAATKMKTKQQKFEVANREASLQLLVPTVEQQINAKLDPTDARSLP